MSAVVLASGSAVVLASGSAARARMLRDAGVEVVLHPVALDEEEVRQACKAEGMDAAATAETLAWMKADRAARHHPGALVIGADQMLDLNGEWLEKPTSETGLRDQLQKLRGKRHELLSGVVAVRDGERLWHAVERARLLVRPFSDDFLEWYVAAAGQGVLQSVGGYHLESLGSQLFSRVEGDYFTVLGLPLLPLLSFLRENGVLRI
jgi:septum formation protein